MRRLIVHIENQLAELWDGDRLIKTYVISTAKNGPGCAEGSLCTPTGRLRIARKIGDGLPLGGVLKGRLPTGEVWSSAQGNSLADSSDDLILTRILWLEGLEEHNANTLQRYIYLHGTNQESLLGTPASHGCVRFGNADIVEIFELLPEGAEVEIRA